MGYFEELAIDSAQFWKKPSTKKDSENPGWYLGNQRFKLTDRYSSNQYISQLQSKNQQAVIKIVSHACGKSQITRVFDYIGREGEKDSIGFEDDQGKSYNTKEDRESLIKEWSENFISKEKYKNQEWKLTKLHDLEEEKERLEFKKDRESFLDTNKQDRLDDLNKFIEGKYYIDSEGKKTNLKVVGLNDTTHIILSIGGKANIKKATAATRNFLQENFAANGFKYALAVHDDTDNLHFHLIANNKSVFNKNLRFDKADLFVLRNEYSRHLSRLGIERVSTLRKDREEIIEKIKAGVEILKEKNSWYQQKLTNPNSTNFNAYLFQANTFSRIHNLQLQVERRLKFDKDNKSDLTKVMKELRILKKDLYAVESKNTDEILKKTIGALSKDHDNIANKLAGINNSFDIKNGKKKEQLKLFLKAHRKELKEFKSFLTKNSKLGTEKERQEFKQKIEKLDSLIKASKVKGLGI